MLDDELMRGRVSDRISMLPRRNFRVLHVAEVIKGGICTHLRDLIGVGLIDRNWLAKLPPILAERLQGILDTPEA